MGALHFGNGTHTRLSTLAMASTQGSPIWQGMNPATKEGEGMDPATNSGGGAGPCPPPTMSRADLMTLGLLRVEQI